MSNCQDFEHRVLAAAEAARQAGLTETYLALLDVLKEVEKNNIRLAEVVRGN